MRALVLDEPGRPLREAELPVPEPRPGQVLLRVRACGICRNDAGRTGFHASQPVTSHADTARSRGPHASP